jgi:hypothetical protein
MKKLKINKPKIKKPSAKIFKRSKTIEEKVSEAIKEVPRITNDTLADHREDVLSSARKYIYPLKHSKHSIVKISLGLLFIVIAAFLAFCSLDLYDFQGTSGFIYDVTEILPFPVAKVGGTWVSYESYLFELRRNMHYYVTQQQANFSSKDGKAQLASLKTQSLNYAIQAALVNKLANEHRVKVSNAEVNQQVDLLKSQNRLGSSDAVFQEVLNQYYGWSENNFKRELKQELLSQAVVAKLDTAASQRAESVYKQLVAGGNFSQLASQYSDDAQTKANGGEYPNPITLDDPQVDPDITSALFKLQPGYVSGIINTGYTLEIVKVLDRSGTSLHAAHIQFNLQNIDTYLKPIENKNPADKFIKV